MPIEGIPTHLESKTGERNLPSEVYSAIKSVRSKTVNLDHDPDSSLKKLRKGSLVLFGREQETNRPQVLVIANQIDSKDPHLVEKAMSGLTSIGIKSIHSAEVQGLITPEESLQLRMDMSLGRKGIITGTQNTKELNKEQYGNKTPDSKMAGDKSNYTSEPTSTMISSQEKRKISKAQAARQSVIFLSGLALVSCQVLTPTDIPVNRFGSAQKYNLEPVAEISNNIINWEQTYGNEVAQLFVDGETVDQPWYFSKLRGAEEENGFSRIQSAKISYDNQNNTYLLEILSPKNETFTVKQEVQGSEIKTICTNSSGENVDIAISISMLQSLFNKFPDAQSIEMLVSTEISVDSSVGRSEEKGLRSGGFNELANRVLNQDDIRGEDIVEISMPEFSAGDPLRPERRPIQNISQQKHDTPDTYMVMVVDQAGSKHYYTALWMNYRTILNG